MRKLYLFFVLIGLKGVAQVPQWEWDTIVNWIVQGYGGPYLKVRPDLKGNFYTIENFSIVNKYGLDKTILWSKVFNGSILNNVVTSSNGDIFISGQFQGTLSVENYLLNTHGAIDLFLARMDSLGNIMWLKQLGSKYRDEGGDICLDEESIFMTGAFADTVFVENSAIPKSNGNDLFIAKFDYYGDLVDMKFSKVNDTQVCSALGAEIKLGGNGKLYILARMNGESTYQNTVFNCWYTDLIWRLDKNFNLEWSKDIGRYYYGFDFDLNADSEGNLIYVTRSYYNHEGPGGSVIKLSQTGETIWTEDIHPNNAIMGIDLDVNGNVYYTGWRARKAAIPPSTEEGVVMNYFYTGMKFSNGHLAWLREDSAKSVSSVDIVVLKNNELVVAGNFSDTLFLKDTLISNGNSFLASLRGIDLATPIQNVESRNTYSISPNPSSGKFNLGGLPQNSELKIYNVCGTCIYSDKTSQENSKIDISGNSPGVYFLEAKNSNGIIRKKLIVE